MAPQFQAVLSLQDIRARDVSLDSCFKVRRMETSPPIDQIATAAMR